MNMKRPSFHSMSVGQKTPRWSWETSPHLAELSECVSKSSWIPLLISPQWAALSAPATCPTSSSCVCLDVFWVRKCWLRAVDLWNPLQTTRVWQPWSYRGTHCKCVHLSRPQNTWVTAKQNTVKVISAAAAAATLQCCRGHAVTWGRPCPDRFGVNGPPENKCFGWRQR